MAGGGSSWIREKRGGEKEAAGRMIQAPRRQRRSEDSHEQQQQQQQEEKNECFAEQMESEGAHRMRPRVSKEDDFRRPMTDRRDASLAATWYYARQALGRSTAAATCRRRRRAAEPSIIAAAIVFDGVVEAGRFARKKTNPEDDVPLRDDRQ